MRVKWLHISDIHFNYRNYDSDLLRQDFIERIKEIGATEPFTHLFLTGDILFRNEEPNKETLTFIETLIRTVNIDYDHVFLVPGNHDHDRDQTIQYTSDIYSKTDEKTKIHESEKISQEETSALLDSFKRFNNIYTDVFGKSYYSKENSPHCFVKCGSTNIVKINTAWLDTKSSLGETLCVGSYQLQQVLSENAEDLKSGINIAVGHHPIIDLLPIEQERLFDLFQRHNIGLYFCGHRHKPEIYYSQKYDVIQFTCPGGYIDDEGYSEGGYIWGILDTDCDFYKAEAYAWNNGKWSIERNLPGANPTGIYYLGSKKFRHNSEISVFDIKTFNGHVAQKQLEQAIGSTEFCVVAYDQPNPLNWDIAAEGIENLAREIEVAVAQNHTTHLFPLAPIPLLLKLGFELQNNSRMIIHQYDRNTNSWVYYKEKEAIAVEYQEQIIDAEDLVVSISTSAIVNRIQIDTSINLPRFDYVEFKIPNIALGNPMYSIDVIEVAKVISDYLNTVAPRYNSLHLFAAIPAGLAVELGRRLLKSICVNIHTYQLLNRQYEAAITINPAIPNNPRNIKNISEQQTKFILLPVAGEIACGPQKEAIIEADNYLSFPVSLLGSGDHFVLQAKGDSMVDAGIFDGDYVIVHKQDTADSGQIVVARIGNETTLKRLIKDEKHERIILHPENDAFSDIEVNQANEFAIQGVVIKVIKDIV